MRFISNMLNLENDFWLFLTVKFYFGFLCFPIIINHFVENQEAVSGGLYSDFVGYLA